MAGPTHHNGSLEMNRVGGHDGMVGDGVKEKWRKTQVFVTQAKVAGTELVFNSQFSLPGDIAFASRKCGLWTVAVGN